MIKKNYKPKINTTLKLSLRDQQKKVNFIIIAIKETKDL